MIRLAAAYLFKRPVQVLAVIGMAIGLGSLLLVSSVMNGLIESDRAAARGPLADLLFIPTSSERGEQWADYQEALLPLMAPEGPLKSYSPHLISYAVLGLQGGERLLAHTLASDVNGVQLVGIDPISELTVGGYADSLQQTELFPIKNAAEPFTNPSNSPFARPGVLVPDPLANALGLKVGETIEVAALPPQLPSSGDSFQPHNARFTIAGTFMPTDYELGMDRIYAERTGENGLLWNLLGDNGSDFNEILIDLKTGINPTSAKEEILSAFKAKGLNLPSPQLGGSLETWQERRATYLMAIENEQRLTSIIMFFVVIVAAFGLFATLSALVREKVRDLGILAAIGYSPINRGALLFLTGCIGSALGCILGFLGANWLAHDDRLFILLNSCGIEVFGSDLYIIKGLPTLWNSTQALNFSGIAFLTGCLFTLFPAIRAAKLSPIEALSYE